MHGSALVVAWLPPVQLHGAASEGAAARSIVWTTNAGVRATLAFLFYFMPSFYATTNESWQMPCEGLTWSSLLLSILSVCLSVTLVLSFAFPGSVFVPVCFGKCPSVDQLIPELYTRTVNSRVRHRRRIFFTQGTTVHPPPINTFSHETHEHSHTSDLDWTNCPRLKSHHTWKPHCLSLPLYVFSRLPRVLFFLFLLFLCL